jgi:hypothetical protein
MEIIHAYIPPEVEGWRSVEETLVAASTPFLSCAAPSFPVCFVLLCCRRFLLPFLAPSWSCLTTPVLVGFGLVWFGLLPSKLFLQVHSEYFSSVTFLISKSSFCVLGACS